MTTEIHSDELYAKQQEGEQIDLIDVRTAGEFAGVHASGAHNHPLDRFDPQAVKQARGERADQPMYLICHAGSRAREAAAKCHKAGVDNVVVVSGGTQAWVQAGLPVNRGRSRGIDVQRQTQLTIGLGVLAGSMLAVFVDHRFGFLSGFFGAGLIMAGSTGLCPLASLLGRMPWNRGGATCSTTVKPA